MPIDPLAEELITAAQAAKLYPPNSRGKHPHLSTVVRHMREGVRGVVLESLQCGGKLATSREAVARLFEQLTRLRESARTRTDAVGDLTAPLALVILGFDKARPALIRGFPRRFPDTAITESPERDVTGVSQKRPGSDAVRVPAATTVPATGFASVQDAGVDDTSGPPAGPSRKQSLATSSYAEPRPVNAAKRGREGSDAVRSEKDVRPAPEKGRCLFRRSGTVWKIQLGTGELRFFQHLDGFLYLAELLGHPNRGFTPGQLYSLKLRSRAESKHRLSISEQELAAEHGEDDGHPVEDAPMLCKSNSRHDRVGGCPGNGCGLACKSRRGLPQFKLS
jgi:hypothetical protein